MKKFANVLGRFFKDEEGASAIEYALILGMVALAIITFVPGIRGSINTIFSNISTALSGTATTP